MVRLEDIEVGLKAKLSKQPISPRVLLDRLRMLDESSRKTSQYQDPNYLPFYYYLSKSIVPKSIFCFGLDLALPICCFLNGCETAKRILAFQKAGNSFYSPRVALSNIHDIRPSGISLVNPSHHTSLSGVIATLVKMVFARMLSMAFGFVS